jgi:catechol 2,3-dioxygenase-like lactoylglutathione lyase family enzyme
MSVEIEYTGIDHVQLAMPAGQEEQARDFYAGVLSFQEVVKPAGLAGRGGCWFVTATGDVHVHLGIDPTFRPAAKAHPAFVVRDLDAVRRRLAQAGASVVGDDSIDVRRFYTADPFGNRIEFVDQRDEGFTAADYP